jgi:hypothetical protein
VCACVVRKKTFLEVEEAKAHGYCRVKNAAASTCCTKSVSDRVLLRFFLLANDLELSSLPQTLILLVLNPEAIL